MSDTPFYKNHWVHIEDERLERYRKMFGWNPASRVLYDLADIREGHTVAELGCGPGHTAVEIARWTGPSGHVHALDINQDFIDQCRQNAHDAGLSERITPHVSDGSRLPLEDWSLDRITARNTLIYVDELLETLGEFHRVLRDGGKVHAIEGGWHMMVAEPIPSDTWTALARAAAQACRTPDIGRKLAGYLAAAGFKNIQLEVITRPDQDGRLLPMVRNMAGYARDSGLMDTKSIDDALRMLEDALAEKTYLVLAPQFVVVAER